MTPQIDFTTHIDLPTATLPTAAPCVIIIFGATGDLTRRKLLPALFHLACEGCMTGRFQIIGTGRKAMSDDAFSDQLRAGVAASAEIKHFKDTLWHSFSSRIRYLAGNFADPATYTRLATLLETLPDAGTSSIRP